MQRDKEFYREHFASFEVDQLEELIQLDWQADGSLLTAEQVLAIAEILEEKMPSGTTDEEIEADWQSFLNDYLPLLEVEEPITEDKVNKKQPPKHRFAPPKVAWAAGILAVVILSTSVFTQQVYGYNIWENFAQWTAEIFRLKAPVTPNENPNENLYPDALDPRLQPLYTAMKELEIPTTLAPTQIPQRFAEPGIVETSASPFKGVINAFLLEEETLMLSFDYVSGGDSMYEKDDTQVTSLRVNGVTYYFMSNNAQNRVVWTIDQFECSINGTVSYEELKQMVLSIYERG